MIKICLSRILGEQRINQAELARRTGIRPSTINEWYHDFVERVNLEHLDRICEVYNAKLLTLLRGLQIAKTIKKTGVYLAFSSRLNVRFFYRIFSFYMQNFLILRAKLHQTRL